MPFVEEISFGWLLVKTVIAMAVVLALAVVVIRYLLPRLQFAKRKKDSLIEIVDRVGLAPRQALYIVRVGGSLLLVGTNDQGIRKLADLKESDLSGET